MIIIYSVEERRRDTMENERRAASVERRRAAADERRQVEAAKHAKELEDDLAWKKFQEDRMDTMEDTFNKTMDYLIKSQEEREAVERDLWKRIKGLEKRLGVRPRFEVEKEAKEAKKRKKGTLISIHGLLKIFTSPCG